MRHGGSPSHRGQAWLNAVPEAESRRSDRPRSVSAQILSLAVPSLGALIAEPLFLVVDTAMIGNLGTSQLAGVGLAATVLQTVTGLLVFLAYSTTPAVARFLGAGELNRALQRGRDGIWLGLLLGVVIAIPLALTAPWVLSALGASGQTHAHAVEYLQYSMIGLPAMTAILATVGTLRGLADAKTPLVVAGVGFAINIAVNYLLIYVVGLGVIGSALGTSVIQWAMFCIYLMILTTRYRGKGGRLLPTLAGLKDTAQIGSWLLVRSAALRAGILVTVLTATQLGAPVLASHQMVMTIFSTLSFALDALAIAAQALVGQELGASHRREVRELTRTMIRWSMGFGVITGLLLAGLSAVIPRLFSQDPVVIQAGAAGLMVLAIAQPLAGYVFILDGILMGAGDAKYLGIASVVALVLYLPFILFLGWLAAQLDDGSGVVSVVLVWVGFAVVYLGARALTLWWRIRGEAWIVLGSEVGPSRSS